jgi:hypothetical protein
MSELYLNGKLLHSGMLSEDEAEAFDFKLPAPEHKRPMQK